MIKFTKRRAILGALLLIGLLLRLVAIGSNPPSMHADEADTGYTALSLIQTGMDPYGNSWPLHFENQAGNFRSPLYTYSVIPFVYVFGLSPITERVPSVLFGVLLIICVYFLLKHYFANSPIPLAGALVTAINPWMLHLSRTGLEVMLSVLLTTAGILFFKLSLRKKYFLVFSAVAFSLSLFSYHPAKIFTPLILLILFLFNARDLMKMKVYALVSFLIFLFAVSVLGYLAFFESGARHLADVSMFDASRASKVVDQQRTQTTAPIALSSVFSNKPMYFLREFTNMYVGPLSLNYLFINGESNLDKGMGNYGQYHLFELIPLLIGAYVLWNKNKKLGLFLLLWFLIGLIPAGITTTGNYAYRDVNAAIPPITLISIGVVVGVRTIIHTKWNFFLIPYGLLVLTIFSFFLYNYYFSYPVYSRDWWGYSQKEALEYIESRKGQYQTIGVNGGMDWAVLHAFYNDVAPHDFQKAYKDAVVREGKNTINLNNIYFGNIITDTKRLEGNDIVSGKTLIIVPPDYYKQVSADKYFRAVDGGTNLKVYNVNE